MFDETQFLMYQKYVHIFSNVWGGKITYFPNPLISGRSYTQFHGNLRGGGVKAMVRKF